MYYSRSSSLRAMVLAAVINAHVTCWLVLCLRRAIKRRLTSWTAVKAPPKVAKRSARSLKMRISVRRPRKPSERRRRGANGWQIGNNRWRTWERYCRHSSLKWPLSFTVMAASGFGYSLADSWHKAHVNVLLLTRGRFPLRTGLQVIVIDDELCPITTKLVLDQEEETKTPLVQVHKNLVTRLKPHQVDGELMLSSHPYLGRHCFTVMHDADIWTAATAGLVNTAPGYIRHAFVF